MTISAVAWISISKRGIRISYTIRGGCVLTVASVLMMTAPPAKAGVSAGWVNQDSQLVNSFSVGASVGWPYEKEDAKNNKQS